MTEQPFDYVAEARRIYNQKLFFEDLDRRPFQHEAKIRALLRIVHNRKKPLDQRKEAYWLAHLVWTNLHKVRE